MATWTAVYWRLMPVLVAGILLCACQVIAQERDDLPGLLAHAKDADVLVRSQIVVSLHLVKDPRAVVALINILQRDTDLFVRQYAAWSLGELHDKRAIPALITASKSDDTGLQRQAVGALGKLKDPATIPALIALIGEHIESDDNFDNSPSPRALSAIYALGAYGELAVPALIAELKSADNRRLHGAAAALSLIGTPAVAPLLAVMKKLPEDIRLQLLLVLGKMRPPAVDALLPLLNDRDPNTRMQAVMALQWSDDPRIPEAILHNKAGISPLCYLYLRDPRVIQALFAALPTCQPPQREYLVTALRAKTPGVENLDLLLNKLADPDAQTRALAVGLLGSLAHPRAIAPLVTALGDVDAGIRSEAATALGRINDAQVVTPLLTALTDASASVRIAALHSLGQLHPPQAEQPLIRTLKDRESRVRDAAAVALGNYRTPAVVDALHGMLGDNVNTVVLNAASALGNIPLPEARDVLLEALHCGNKQRVAAAIRAMLYTGETDARAEDDLFRMFAIRENDDGLGTVLLPALAQLRDHKRVLPYLLDELTSHQPAWRDEIPRVLAYIGDPSAIPVLLKELQGELDWSSYRKELVTALASFDDPRVKEFFLHALRTRDLAVVRTVYRYYVSHGIAGAEMPLVTAFRYARGYEIDQLKQTAWPELAHCGNPILQEATATDGKELDVFYDMFGFSLFGEDYLKAAHLLPVQWEATTWWQNGPSPVTTLTWNVTK